MVTATMAASSARAQGLTSQPASAAAGVTSGPQQALDEYLGLLRGNNTPEARRIGAARLLELGTPAAVAMLDEVLRASPPDSAAQIAVCSAIADTAAPPPVLIEPLLALLGDQRPGIADAVGRAVRRFETSVVVERLRPVAQDPDIRRSRRLAAIRALGALGVEKTGIAVLAGLLEAEDRTVRQTALAAFCEATGLDPNSSAAEAQAWWRKAAEGSYEHWLRSLVEARIQQANRLRGERTDLGRRLGAAYRDDYLATPDSDRPRVLGGFLNSDLPSVRILGLDLVNDLITDRKDVDPDARTRIGELTTDKDVRVRLRAARLVGDLRIASASVRLLEAMASEHDDEARAAQANALGRLDDPAVIPALVDRLADKSFTVVGEAATALGMLLRRGQRNGAEVTDVDRALLQCYESLPPDEIDLRERFLNALANIAAPAFRATLEREMREGSNPRIRRAAITGLGGYEDTAAAEAIRPLIRAGETVIRLAAVEALGKCGATEEDLVTLAPLLSQDREPDASVRQQAWDSYLAVVQRLPVERHLHISDEFDRPNDVASQRRRLELLRVLRVDGTRFEALAREQKVSVLERMADAQWELGEFSAASASFEQAMGLLTNPDADRFASLARRSFDALLRGREDGAALKRLRELFDGQQVNGELSDAEPMAETLRRMIQSRIDAVTDAAGYANAAGLIAAASAVSDVFGAAFADELSRFLAALDERRDQDVDKLLSALESEPDAEARLIPYGRQAVLPRLYERLSRPLPTSAPDRDAEQRLVRIARKLAPTWEGFEATDAPEKRLASLASLKSMIDAGLSDKSPTSMPGEGAAWRSGARSIGESPAVATREDE